jgi:predicted MFS family arabinose efflux permease
MVIEAPVGTALGALLGWRASFLFLAGFALLLMGLALWLLPQVRRIPDAARPALRKAIAQPGVKSVAMARPLLVLAHFALFTYIAPFTREAGLPNGLTVLTIQLGIAVGALYGGACLPYRVLPGYRVVRYGAATCSGEFQGSG